MSTCCNPDVKKVYFLLSFIPGSVMIKEIIIAGSISMD